MEELREQMLAEQAERIARLQMRNEIRMAGLVADEIKNPQEKYLMISHCNNPEKAEWVRDMIMEKVSFAGSYILNTAGISSMYANDGGIIIAV